MPAELREEDLAQIAEHGIGVGEVRRQIGLFEHPPGYIELVRPCTTGDGIRVLTESEIAAAARHYDEACHRGRLLKFVPASGAASRMFQTLQKRLNQDGPILRDATANHAGQGDRDAGELLSFMDGLERFAFFEDLAAVMARADLDAGWLAAKGQFREILDYLLTSKGLNYASLPKGLLKFHRYSDGNRTAFEEHLVEAAVYVRDGEGTCRLHFTVSPEHEDRFRALFAAVGHVYQDRYAASFQMKYSTQKAATDTIAVDLENRPFRTADGRLLFRPGGHGALIENLNELGGDIVYIKNVDNVVPDYLKATTLHWKKTLAGHLVVLQKGIFQHLERLTSSSVPETVVEESRRFARRVLSVDIPPRAAGEGLRAIRSHLIGMLNRPIRVCGMVRNTGEPGGGPFWVRESDGGVTLQIVESAQVDPSSSEQLAIFRSATHFNPVDIVCGMRGWRGEPFSLGQYVDPAAVFIAEKSQDGRRLKALERPGLWNGAMSRWTTLFVEVPVETFNPVKTVNDLLRPQHQPESEQRSE
jgi:Domain of unknown function (DUF4301)